jgi:hypothetical protein
MSMPNYFAYDPFQRRTRTMRYAPQGDQDTWSAHDREEEYWDLSDALRGADPWLAENWSNPNNMEVTRDGDGYRVRIKTGDKEGTWYNLTPDGSGGFRSSVAGRGEWNTNENLFDDPMALAMMAAVGTIGAGAAGAFSGWGTGGAPAAGAPATPGGGSGLLGGTAAPAASGGGGSVIESMLGQSLATPGSIGAAQSAAPGFMAAATQQSLPAIGAFSGLMPEFAAGIPSAFQALADTPLPSTGGGLGSQTRSIVEPAAKAGASSLASQIGNALGLAPSAVTALGGLLGAGLGYADAKSQEGKKQGENQYWSQYMRQNVNLGGAPGTRPDMSQLRGMIGQRAPMDMTNLNQSRQAMSGLLGNVPRSNRQPEENERLRQVFGLLGL